MRYWWESLPLSQILWIRPIGESGMGTMIFQSKFPFLPRPKVWLKAFSTQIPREDWPWLRSRVTNSFRIAKFRLWCPLILSLFLLRAVISSSGLGRNLRSCLFIPVRWARLKKTVVRVPVWASKSSIGCFPATRMFSRCPLLMGMGVLIRCSTVGWSSTPKWRSIWSKRYRGGV